MKCKEIIGLLDDYILGELTPEIEMQINGHLDECRSCNNELQKREAELALIKHATIFKPDNEAFRRIKRILPNRDRSAASVLSLPKRFIYAFAAFILGIVLMRSLDILFFTRKEIPQAEIKYETRHHEPFVDTVEFYYAPAKNVAKI